MKQVVVLLKQQVFLLGVAFLRHIGCPAQRAQQVGFGGGNQNSQARCALLRSWFDGFGGRPVVVAGC